ncbi:sigma-70 family RNA polymerase sigma factor [Myxococcota bacterium]|nr:sigma-70 family RNA polymerase sigma factor [Myxococcota bacterium]MBU1535368.1 sigma-70 family RNA polymerase sigma factor [Myxococcota bacterium]
MKDAELIGAAAEGDETAFQHLVKRHRSWAFGFVLKTVRDPEAAGDILQEAFVRVFKNLAKFRMESSFNTWFHRILYNLCIDYWRRSGRRIHMEYDDSLAFDGKGVGTAGGYDATSPERNNRRKEVVGILEQALDSLSLEHRTAILLREVEGLSYEEIADIIDCPKGTVMSRLHHARKKIVSFMKRYGYVSSEI